MAYSFDHRSARQRVLELLQENDWVNTWDLIMVGGSEAPRRLRELRADGHVIEKRPVEGSQQWEYRLVA